MKKLAIISPIALIASIYLFAMWNASSAREYAEQFSEQSSRAMQAYADRPWQRPWVRGGPRDCNAVRGFVEQGVDIETPGGLTELRVRLLEGRDVHFVHAPVGEEVGRAAGEASRCKRTQSVSRISLDGVEIFDWPRHLELVTVLSAHAVQLQPAACLDLGVRVAELASDASTAGGVAAMSYAEVEMNLATEVVERCAPRAPSEALEVNASKLRAVVDADLPFWRSLEAEALLVEKGAYNAARDIRRMPTDLIELKEAIFTGVVLKSWRRAIRFRQQLEERVESDGPARAAEFWETSFADRDDKYEYILAPRPAEHIERFQAARNRLASVVSMIEQMSEENSALQFYRRHGGGVALRVFERRYRLD